MKRTAVLLVLAAVEFDGPARLPGGRSNGPGGASGLVWGSERRLLARRWACDDCTNGLSSRSSAARGR